MLAALVFVLLPAQAESVAWITGRVDSMPAFFYLASFLAWMRWRTDGGALRYGAAVALFFVALFTKQNTITMVPALIAYDLLLGGGRRAERDTGATGRWAAVWPYVPFVLLTAGYLGLRYVLFGAVAREDQLNANSAAFFLAVATRHLQRLVAGTAGLEYAWPALAVAAAAILLLVRRSTADRRRLLRVALYFGVLWVAFGIAPVAVAGYESPRHIYLASVGWALTVGAAWAAVAAVRPQQVWRRVATVAVVALLVGYAVQLVHEVRTWNARSAVSRQAASDLAREALSAPPGTLLIAGAPVRSWEWALPFVARPPFAPEDLTRRVRIITPQLLHCCRGQWEDYTRATVRAWTAESPRPPALALYWDERTGELSRVTDAQAPDLSTILTLLTDIDGAEAMNDTLVRMLRELVAGRATATNITPN
jgi:hypothetical protein